MSTLRSASRNHVREVRHRDIHVTCARPIMRRVVACAGRPCIHAVISRHLTPPPTAYLTSAHRQCAPFVEVDARIRLVDREDIW